MFQFFAGRVKVFAAFWTASALWRFSIRSRGAKAAEHCRSPRRFRGSAPTSAVQAPMLSEKRRGALHELPFCPRPPPPPRPRSDDLASRTRRRRRTRTNQFQRAARGYARVRAITVQPVFLNSNSSPLAVTLILSPGLNSPSSSLIESGSSSFSWIARLSGRAPNCGS